MGNVPPGLILILAGLLAAVLRGRVRQACLVIAPVLSGAHILLLTAGTSTSCSLFGYELLPVHVDRLSLVWGYVFHLAALISVVYAWHVDDWVQHASAMIYAGAAIGAVFAGDLVTLFVYWELTAVSSVFLVWATRTERASRAGMRYLLMQVGSGVLLLAGVLLHFRNTGSLAFVEAFRSSLPEAEGLFAGIDSLDTLLIFLAFGVKAAFPLLHTWVPDAYPEATPTGTVFLSAFTTKLAVYALARGFPGTGILIWIGAAMAVLPLVYALIENDLRRVLAYSLNNQLGFMVVGVGVADFVHHPEVAELAINGVAGHAFAHILYKGLLFMAVGAVLYRTGTARCTELGGLVRSMPWTALFCLIGVASIAATPLFSGFVTKSMILSAVGESHLAIPWTILVVAASAGVLADLKVPYCAFFGSDSGHKPAEAPRHMLIAMGAAAVLCVAIGIMPGPFFHLLPYQVEYHPYTMAHIVGQLQLLVWSGLAFMSLNRLGVFPSETSAINLDSDWFFRRPFSRVDPSAPPPATRVVVALAGLRAAGCEFVGVFGRKLLAIVRENFGPAGRLSRTTTVGGMALWAAVLLTAYLLLYYVAV